MRAILVVLLALLVVAFSVPAVAAPPDMAIKVLSNRADLISGNDALIEVVLPPDVDPAEVQVTVNGSAAAGSFGTSIDGRFIGLVEGLVSGDNVVEALVDPASTALRRPRARLIARWAASRPRPSSGGPGQRFTAAIRARVLRARASKIKVLPNRVEGLI